jgi:L-lactate dehydrogenase complex protein LldE
LEGKVLQVSLFITCYNDTLFPETGKAVVKVLERLGHTVDFPAGQTCCGQMHWNTGYQAEALPLVGRFVERLGLTDVGAYYPHRVTYHASCHGLRNLELGDGPMSLLRAVKGIDLVQIGNMEQCCGFGGTFAVKNADVSSAMLAEKTTAVLNTGAEACTACDNSCLMHIQGALHRQRTGVRTVHLAEILAGAEGDVL